MAKIETREEFRNWSDGKPDEIAITIAVRAALRVLPLVATELSPHISERPIAFFAELTSSLFRCVSLAVAQVKFRSSAHELSEAATIASNAAENYASGVAPAIPLTSTFMANGNISIAYCAAYAAVNVARARTASTAESAVVAAAGATFAAEAATYFSSMWKEIGRDTDRIDGRQSEAELLDAPLWTGPRPDWALENWQVMRNALPSADQWQVWIDWYEARLAGRATSEAYDLTFVDVPEDEWKKGPAAGNAWIAANLAKLPKETLRDVGDILARIRKDPAGAPIRIVNGKAAIESNESDDDFAVAAQPQTQQLLARARVRAAAAREHAFKLSNQRGFENIASDVDEFSRLLSGDANLLAENISIAWELSSSIGAFAERDEEVKSGRGGLTPQMDAGPREAIDQLLTASAALIRRFPTAREHDEAVRISRQPRESLAPTKEIFESAKSGALLEKSTERVLGSAIDAGERSDGVQAEKNRAFASGTTRSMIVAFMVGGSAYAMSLGGKFVEGAVTKAGEHFYEHSAIGETIDRFLLEKEKEIAELFKDLPADVRSAIREVLRRIREGKPPPSPPRVDPTTSV